MNTPPESSLLPDAFATLCESTPDALAIQHETLSLDYRALDRYANSIAQQLIDAGLVAGDRVGFCMERSVHAVATMLGCFKAATVFVPLDPDYPAERLAFMLDDAEVKHLILSPSCTPLFDAISMPSLVLDDDSIRYADQPPNRQLTGDALAYIMYTSGSTGKPKGVPISHGALINYCKADAEVYQLSASDRTLQFSTLSFDIAIEEIFPPLITGGAVIVRPRERSEASIELSDLVERYDITALHMATGYWHEWVDIMDALGARVPSTIRLMVVTGEKVSPEHFRRWQSLTDHETLWANAYGPTETTVTATVFVPPADWYGDALPIGKPLPGYTAVILDADNAPVAGDQTGELCIGGPSLADGYLNRPEQTAKAFIVDPAGDGTQRLYRTGDLARWLPDGNIAYAGRIDHQLKVGSYRIEPGEIENAINRQAGVLESLVVADESGGKKRLLAYVAHGDNNLDLATLSAGLSASLPDYMVPSRYVLLTGFAKTINGKIDRDALPDASAAVTPRRSDFVEATTDTEKHLTAIWRDVLNIDEIGVEDSFFTLGGDSLMATRAIARMQQELGTTLSTRDFFYLETVGMMAGQIDGQVVERVVPPPVAAFINTRGRQLYTVLQPARKSHNRNHGILFVPPLGNEQRRIQRPMRSIMQHLSRKGFTLLRFDWQGTANSSGDCATQPGTLPWIENIEDAADALAKQCDQFDLVGIRMGALLANQCALSTLPLRHRIYWEPVLDGADWLDNLGKLHRGVLADTYRFLRPRWQSRSTAREFAGLELSDSLYSEIRTMRLLDALQPESAEQRTMLILQDDMSAKQAASGKLLVQRTEDNNNWYSARATTSDMNVNSGAAALTGFVESPVSIIQTQNRWAPDHAA